MSSYIPSTNLYYIVRDNYTNYKKNINQNTRSFNSVQEKQKLYQIDDISYQIST